MANKKWLGAISINTNCSQKSCTFNSTRKMNLGRDFIRRKQYQLCCKLVEKLYVGLIEIQSLNITVLAYVKRLFASLKKKVNVFKELIVSNVSAFSFWVIGPIRKDGNGGILRKSYFSGKQMSGMLFSRVKTGYLDKDFSKSLMRTETSLGRNNKCQTD